MKQYTEEQQSIINLKEGKHIVLAPPGSGKTEILAVRVNKNTGSTECHRI